MHWMAHRTTLYDVLRSFLNYPLLIQVLIHQIRTHLSQVIQKMAKMKQIVSMKKLRQQVILMKKLKQVVLVKLSQVVSMKKFRQ